VSSKGFGTRQTVFKPLSSDSDVKARSEESRLKVDLSHLFSANEPVTQVTPPAKTALPPAFATHDGSVANQVAPSEPDQNFIDPRQILNSIGEVIYTWDITTDQLS